MRLPYRVLIYSEFPATTIPSEQEMPATRPAAEHEEQTLSYSLLDGGKICSYTPTIP